MTKSKLRRWADKHGAAAGDVLDFLTEELDYMDHRHPLGTRGVADPAAFENALWGLRKLVKRVVVRSKR